jgi:hypothetical protein
MFGVSPAFIDLSREEAHLLFFSWKAILVFVQHRITGSTETPVQIPGGGAITDLGCGGRVAPACQRSGDVDLPSGARRRGTETG